MNEILAGENMQGLLDCILYAIIGGAIWCYTAWIVYNILARKKKNEKI